MSGASKLQGSVLFKGHKQEQLIIEALGSREEILGVVKLSQPGPFSIVIGIPAKVTMRVYIDTDNDGAPSVGEPPIYLDNITVDLINQPDVKVTVNLDKGEISLVK